jgi:hypothetical protein
MKTGTFIYDENKNLIEVTDINKAYEQAKNFVEIHEQSKKAKEQGINVYYFHDAHKHWKHILFELEKLIIKKQSQ